MPARPLHYSYRHAKPLTATPVTKEIISKFANKESEFAKAREKYTYRQSLKMHELDDRGSVTGKWELVADVIFSANGKRTERIVRAPVPTLKLIITPEDEADLRNVQPFVLTSKDIDNYDVHYLGREKLDEISCYTFSVKPKKLEKGLRYFQGQVWVDDKDLQIVKSYGRGTGLQKKGSDQQFPKFETYREPAMPLCWNLPESPAKPGRPPLRARWLPCRDARQRRWC